MTADAAARTGRHEAEIVGDQRSGGRPDDAPETNPLVLLLAEIATSIVERDATDRAARHAKLAVVSSDAA